LTSSVARSVLPFSLFLVDRERARGASAAAPPPPAALPSSATKARPPFQPRLLTLTLARPQLPALSLQMIDSFVQVGQALRTCADTVQAFADASALANPSEISSLLSILAAGHSLKGHGGDDDDGKKKRKRSLKDPNAPKRPVTAYLQFQNEVKNEVQDLHRDKAYKDILRLVAEKWKGLDDEVKQVCPLAWPSAAAAFLSRGLPTGADLPYLPCPALDVHRPPQARHARLRAARPGLQERRRSLLPLVSILARAPADPLLCFRLPRAASRPRPPPPLPTSRRMTTRTRTTRSPRRSLARMPSRTSRTTRMTVRTRPSDRSATPAD
jgi:hypothetical protein